MRPVATTALLCVTLLLSAVFPGVSEGVPLEGKTVCLLPLADLSPKGDLGDYADVISDDLGVALQQAGVPLVAGDEVRKAVASRRVSPKELLGPTTAESVAREAGGDLALNGFVALQDDTLRVSLRVYDARSGVLLAGMLRDVPFDMSLYAYLWEEVSTMLATAIPIPAAAVPAAAALPAPPRQKEPAAADGIAPGAGGDAPAVTFTSRQDGMEVLLADGTSLGRIENGQLVVPASAIDPHSPLVVSKRLAGFHDARQATRPGSVIPLSPLAHSNRMAVELDWTAGQLLGAGAAVRVYAVPDFLFISPSFYLSGQPPIGSAGNTAFHADAGLLIGGYLFFPPESLFRIGVSTGGGAVVSWVSSTTLPLFVDAYVDIVNAWAEMNVGWFSLFLRSELKYAVGGQTPNLLGQGLVLWAGVVPPITLGVLLKW